MAMHMLGMHTDLRGMTRGPCCPQGPRTPPQPLGNAEDGAGW